MKLNPSIRVVLGLTLNVLLGVLSYLVPKRKNTILLGGGLGRRFTGNPKYFYSYLLEQVGGVPGYRFRPAWITKSKALYDEFSRARWRVVLATRLSGFWAILRNEYLIIECGTAVNSSEHDIAYERVLIGRFKIIQTWHGSPLKKITLDAMDERERPGLVERLYRKVLRFELGRLTAIISLSDTDARILKRAFNNDNILVTGYPKNDIFTAGGRDGRLNRNLEQYEKIILYAPTFRDHGEPVYPFSDRFLDHLDGRLAQANWCFLVKKHPYDLGLQIDERFRNIRDVTHEVSDIQELLADTDLLITDYSSVFIDFLLKDAPQIAYLYDLEDYNRRSRSFYYEISDVVPGPIATREDELLELIFTCDDWYRTPEYKLRRRDKLHFFHKFIDGDSSKRLEEKLLAGFSDSR